MKLSFVWQRLSDLEHLEILLLVYNFSTTWQIFLIEYNFYTVKGNFTILERPQTLNSPIKWHIDNFGQKEYVYQY